MIIRYSLPKTACVMFYVLPYRSNAQNLITQMLKLPFHDSHTLKSRQQTALQRLKLLLIVLIDDELPYC